MSEMEWMPNEQIIYHLKDLERRIYDLEDKVYILETEKG